MASMSDVLVTVMAGALRAALRGVSNDTQVVITTGSLRRLRGQPWDDSIARGNGRVAFARFGRGSECCPWCFRRPSARCTDGTCHYG